MTESQLSLLHLAKAEISEKKNETNKSRLMQLRSRNSTEKCGEYENSDIIKLSVVLCCTHSRISTECAANNRTEPLSYSTRLSRLIRRSLGSGVKLSDSANSGDALDVLRLSDCSEKSTHCHRPS